WRRLYRLFLIAFSIACDHEAIWSAMIEREPSEARSSTRSLRAPRLRRTLIPPSALIRLSCLFSANPSPLRDEIALQSQSVERTLMNLLFLGSGTMGSAAASCRSPRFGRV